MKFPKQLHDLFVAHQKKRNSTQLSDHLTTQCVFKFNDIFECSNAPVHLELVSASLLGFQECYCRHAYSALAKKLKGARRLISHFMSKVGPVIDLDMNDRTFDEARFYLRHAAMLGARKLRKHCKKFKKHNDFHYLRAAVRKLGRSSSA